MRVTDLAIASLFGAGIVLIICLGIVFYRRSQQRRVIAHFEAHEIDLMETAMDLIPNLTLTTYIASLARKRGRYPLKSHEDFLLLTEGERILSFKGRTLSFDQVEQFFPKEFFPIEDEQQLLCRLLIAFQRGDFFHAEERLKNTNINAFVNNRALVVMPLPQPERKTG